MSTTIDSGTYQVSISRMVDNRIQLTVGVPGAQKPAYEQILPASYGDALPSYDIDFHTSATSVAHPLDEMEYHYGPELGAEILVGVFDCADEEFEALEYGAPMGPVVATMGAAHDALALCQERKKLN